MKMIKKILVLIFEPIRALSNRTFAEKAESFFAKNKWAIYVLSLLVTAIILFLVYFLPNISW